MGIPGVEIQTLHNPIMYSARQIDLACRIARMLGRRRLVLTEKPER